MRRLIRPIALLTLVIGLTAGGALLRAEAQGPDAPDPGAEAQDDRATSFRAVSGAEAEEVPGGTLLIASYAIIWVFLMLYLHRVGRLSAGVRADVERLSGILEAKSGGEGAG